MEKQWSGIVVRTGFLMLVATLILWGCSSVQKTDTKGSEPITDGSDVKPKVETAVELPAGLFLKEALKDAVELGKARKTAKEGDTVVIRAQIGGEKKPFIDGLALMTVCDTKIVSCDERSGDNCKFPWDMCCDARVAHNRASIQINGADDKMLKTGLEGKGGLYPLSVILVKGKVGPRPDPKAFVIHAEQIFVEKVGIVREKQ